MPQEHVVSIDPSKPLVEESGMGQNRWHEAIEPVVEVDSGEAVVYETRDAFEEQLSSGVGPRGPGHPNLLPRVARRARREVGRESGRRHARRTRSQRGSQAVGG